MPFPIAGELFAPELIAQNTAEVTALSAAEKERALALEIGTVATENATAAGEANVIVEGEQVVKTEALSAAQAFQVGVTEILTSVTEGLNAAMLANPVLLILGGLVALVGIYELYTHTLGAATDAEEAHKAAVEATDEANKKAIDTIAKDESSLQTLLITAT